MAVGWLTRLFNGILEGERMPDEWRKSVLVPIFKNKGDVQSCSNYRGIKLLSYAMKIWERVVEKRLRRVVRISDEQFGFMPGRSTTDAIFALRMMMEKYREGQKELHCVFIDLESGAEIYRSGAERRAVVLHEVLGSGREVCEGGEGHVRKQRNSSKVCCRNDGGFRSGGGTAPGIGFELRPVCSSDGQTD